MRTLAVALGAALLCGQASAATIAGSAANDTGTFRSYWFSTTVPAATWTGLSGTLAISSARDGLAETLFTLYALPSCPRPGKAPDLSQGTTLGNWILKGSGPGTFDLPLDFTLPVGIPVSGCLALNAFGDGVISVDLGVAMTDADPPSSPDLIGVGGEACFGADDMRASVGAGCEGLGGGTNATDPSQAFASISHITSPGTLTAIIGSISAATFAGPPLLDPPDGAWTYWTDTYLLHRAACGRFPRRDGFYGPADWYGRIPAGARDLISVALAGNGQDTQQEPIGENFDLTLKPGDCIVHVMALQADGGVDAEDQLALVVS